jgi:uncharacterized protein (DUF1810 family)
MAVAFLSFIQGRNERFDAIDGYFIAVTLRCFARFRLRKNIMADRFDLGRFVKAQDRVYDQVLAELRAGRKRSHWMWFIFPQVKGLGTSAMAERFAISGREEAAAYLAHPLLGPRLRECTRLVIGAPNRSIETILGHPDDLKFRSSMTLFAETVANNADFVAALDRFFGGALDPLTLERL